MFIILSTSFSDPPFLMLSKISHIFTLALTQLNELNIVKKSTGPCKYYYHKTDNIDILYQWGMLSAMLAYGI